MVVLKASTSYHMFDRENHCAGPSCPPYHDLIQHPGSYLSPQAQALSATFLQVNKDIDIRSYNQIRIGLEACLAVSTLSPNWDCADILAIDPVFG